MPDWQRFSDYQLCYWYAREIERRQVAFEAWFESRGLDSFRIEMRELTQWTKFEALAAFVTDQISFTWKQKGEGKFKRIISTYTKEHGY